MSVVSMRKSWPIHIQYTVHSKNVFFIVFTNKSSHSGCQDQDHNSRLICHVLATSSSAISRVKRNTRLRSRTVT